MKQVLVLIVAATCTATASVARLANVFTDNMVLQRDMRVGVWGAGEPSEALVVRFADQEKKTQVSADGSWKVFLDPMAANPIPQVLTVTAGDAAEAVLKNVLVGDVWVFSGAGHERTMEQLGHDTAKLLPKAQAPLVRVLRPDQYNSLFPVSDVNADCRWIEVNPKDIARYSVSWYFGQHLQELTQVPVGIVLATKSSQDAREFFAWENSPADQRQQGIAKRISDKLPEDIANAKRWLQSMENCAPGDLIDLLPFPSYVPYTYYGQSPNFDNGSYPYPNEKTSVFNAMVFPLRNMTVRGVVFFNEFEGRATFPDYTFTEIVAKWRARFGQSQLPFVIPEMQNDKFSQRFDAAVAKLGETSFVQVLKKDELPFSGRDGGGYWEKLAEIADGTPMYKQEVAENIPALPEAEKVQVPDFSAKLRTSHMFSSNMVLQRDMPVKIWGWTPAPKEAVSLDFAGQSQLVESDGQGRWEVTLARLAASKTPRAMTITSRNEKLVYDNILVGEVWINSGQSNAGFAMGGTFFYEDEVKTRLDDHIRYFYNTKTTSVLPLKSNYANGWKVLNQDTLAAMSGQGYHFAKEISKELDVPVGIIEANMGGAHIIRFCNAETLQGNPKLKAFYDDLVAVTDDARRSLPELRRCVQDWVVGAEMNAGLERPFPPFPIDMSPFKPFYSWYQSHMSERGATLFNTLIGPMQGLAFRGVLWNQGEADRFPPMLGVYDELCAAMVSHWRRFFDNEFPFYFVGMPAMKGQDALLPFWEKQVNCTSLIPDSAMIVSNDISEADQAFGRAIHPRNKKDVGQRLALLALSRTYGEKGFVDSSPFMQKVVRDGDRLMVTFAPVGEGLRTRDGKEPDSWELAGADGKFIPAKAVIENDKVMVSAEGIDTPVAVRLGWQPDSNCNLVNSAGLPAMPFRQEL